MRLLFLLVTFLAFSLAEIEHEQKHYEDLEAAESIELQKDLKPAASAYNSVPYPSWNQPQTYPPQQHYPQPTWPQKPPNPAPIGPAISPPYTQPGYTTQRPLQDYPTQPPYYPTQPPYYPTQPPHYHHHTTTPVPVIKNEQHFGADGSYKYEYQIADGTWVGEEGYYTNPKQTDESLVKKGWYQYVGADGKTYTVTYWADHTGYHAFGEHLPTPPPIPPAIQASIDQNAKEEAAKAEAEKNKPYYPTQKPIYYDPPQQPSYPAQQPNYPPQQTYYPPQQTYYPPQNNYPAGK